jgi:hypothetical protein
MGRLPLVALPARVQARSGDDVAAIPAGVEAGTETRGGVADLGPWTRVGEEDVPAAAAGERLDRDWKRAVRRLETSQRLIAGVARVDVERDEAGTLPGQ